MNWFGAAVALCLSLVVVGYIALIRMARRYHNETHVAEKRAPIFSETERNRYARHLILREIGGQGQQRLKRARILVVGAGGLGAPILQYLGAAGVGTLGIIDDDVVSLSNLQRQVIYGEDDLNKSKVFAAQARLRDLNPHIEVRPYNRRLTEEIALELFSDYDLILDGTDEYETRALVNHTAVSASKPLITGAISQWDGQITLVDKSQNTPCTHCVFPHPPNPQTARSCAQGGVMGALPGIIGSILAAEAIKYVTKSGTGLAGRMILYDALHADMRIIKISEDPSCRICANRHGRSR